MEHSRREPGCDNSLRLNERDLEFQTRRVSLVDELGLNAGDVMGNGNGAGFAGEVNSLADNANNVTNLIQKLTQELKGPREGGGSPLETGGGSGCGYGDSGPVSGSVEPASARISAPIRHTGNPAAAVVQVIANDGAVPGGTEISEGSGFFVTSNGGIVTDYHVVHGAKGPIQIILANGRTVEARVAKVDAADDLALLQVIGGRNGEFPTLPIAGDSAATRTDTAFGHPGGQAPIAQIRGTFDGTVPLSDFSIADIRSEDPGFNFNRKGDMFTMNIQPGDSGGPILNSKGQVISVVDLGGAGCGIGTPAQNIRKLLA